MTQMEIQKIISNYARDSDPRVRKVKKKKKNEFTLIRQCNQN